MENWLTIVGLNFYETVRRRRCNTEKMVFEKIRRNEKNNEIAAEVATIKHNTTAFWPSQELNVMQLQRTVR